MIEGDALSLLSVTSCRKTQAELVLNGLRTQRVSAPVSKGEKSRNPEDHAKEDFIFLVII